jgi:hypothetical protein
MTQTLPLLGLVVIAIAYLPLKFISGSLTMDLLLNTQQLTCLNLQAKCTQKLSTKQEWW